VERELAIRLRGVVKRYGAITAVNGLDLDVPAGTCGGLLGPNGAGKSTTMRLLTAQSIADAGELEVLGFRLPEESKMARAQCGVTPQLDNLDTTLTVGQNLLVFAHLPDRTVGPTSGDRAGARNGEARRSGLAGGQAVGRHAAASPDRDGASFRARERTCRARGDRV
jgi:ABC-type sugar transport system ATPase subunit